MPILTPDTQLAVGTLSGPTSLIANWVSILTGPTSARNLATDGFGGVNIANSVVIFKRNQGTGTNVRFRLLKTTNVASTTALKYKLLGGFCLDDSNIVNTDWEVLPTVGGDDEATITPTTSDLYSTGGTSGFYTAASWTDHTNDCGGCTHFAFAVTQGLVLSDSSQATAIVQAKII